MRPLVKLVGTLALVFVAILIVTFIFSFIKKVWFGGKVSSSNHVAVMEITGMITGSTHIVREIGKYRDSKSTKALIVRVNSPGGLVAPSQEIYDALKKTDVKIPVIISMASVAASGGYYLALGGRKIISSPGTLTGSIGVIMEFTNTEKLYDWAKIQRFSLTSGKFKDAGSPFKQMKPEEKALFQAMIQDIYSQFRGAVKERRKLSDKEVDAVADGRVLTGNQALQAKLVDQLGGIEEAIAEAKKMANLPESAQVVYPEAEGSWLKRILLGEEWEAKINHFLSYWEPPRLSSISTGTWRPLLIAPVY